MEKTKKISDGNQEDHFDPDRYSNISSSKLFTFKMHCAVLISF